MKKICTLAIFVLFLFIQGFSQSGIYGGDFEHWKFNTTYQYFEPDSSYFSTLNKLDTVVAMQPMITTYRCDTAHSGNYSAKLLSRYYEFLNILIPGVIGTAKINWASFTAILGIPYPYGDSVPRVFSGYYQSYPVANDSTAALILLSRWNPTLKKRDTIAYNCQKFHGTVNTWTQFSMPVIYRDLVHKPDSLTVLMLSAGGFNASNFFGSVGQPGTVALFDDVSLSGVNGIPLLLMPPVSVKLSPNPARDILRMELGRIVNDGNIELYNAQGKFLESHRVDGKFLQINVSRFSAGMYYYKLTCKSELLNSGTFIVIK